MVEKMVEKIKRKRNKTTIYMYENDLCYICLETCKKPGTLDLNCDCNYSVHKKCFDKWYRINKTCIICHEKCNSIKKHGTVILKSNISNINININQNGYEGLFFLFYFILFLKIISFLNEGTHENKLTLEN